MFELIPAGWLESASRIYNQVRRCLMTSDILFDVFPTYISALTMSKVITHHPNTNCECEWTPLVTVSTGSYTRAYVAFSIHESVKQVHIIIKHY